MARQPPKCCCCVPLRPGLLAWAYIRLVLALTSIGAYVYFMGPRLRYLVNSISRHQSPIGFFFNELLPLFVLCLPYLVFTIIFIVGLQRQNSKLLRVFLVYSIFEVIVAGAGVGWQVYDFVQDLSYYSQHNYETYDTNHYNPYLSPLLYLRPIILIVVNMVLPIYFIVLIKSEVQRLKTAPGETRVVLDVPVTRDQDRKYYFVDETPDFRKPLFPVEELKRLRQQLGVKNV